MMTGKEQKTEPAPSDGLSGGRAGSANAFPGPGLHRFALSDAMGRSTELLVRIPAQPRPDRRYGVIVFLHGARADGSNMLRFLEDFCEAEGYVGLYPSARPLPPQACGQDWFGGLVGAAFSQPDWLHSKNGFALAALRWAGEKLPVDHDRAVLCGLSMGAFAAWNIGLRSWQHFAAIIALAGGLSRWERFGRDGKARFLLANALNCPIFVAHNRDDSKVPVAPDRLSVRTLRRMGHDACEYEEPASNAHIIRLDRDNELTDRIGNWLRQQVRPKHRQVIIHRAFEEDHGEAGWLRLHGVDPAGGRARAKRVGGIWHVTSKGVNRIGIRLTEDDLKDEHCLQVVLNGKAHILRLEGAEALSASDGRISSFDPELRFSKEVMFDAD